MPTLPELGPADGAQQSQPPTDLATTGKTGAMTGRKVTPQPPQDIPTIQIDQVVEQTIPKDAGFSKMTNRES